MEGVWFLKNGQDSPVCVVTPPDGTIPLRNLADHLQLDSTSMFLDGLLISTDSAGINSAATWRELKNVPNLSPGTEEAPIIVDGRGKVVALAAPPPQLKREEPFKFETFYIRIGRRTYWEITRVTKATGIRHVFLQSLKKHKLECSSLKLRGGNEDFCLDEDETGWSELPRYHDYGDTRATHGFYFHLRVSSGSLSNIACFIHVEVIFSPSSKSKVHNARLVSCKLYSICDDL